MQWNQIAPLSDRVLVRGDRELVGRKTDSGLLIPDTAKRAPIIPGEVLKVGPDVKEASVGQIAHLPAFAGVEVFDDGGGRYLLAKESDIYLLQDP